MDGNTKGRRNTLKLAGSALAGLVGVSGVTSAKKKTNYDFDPEDESEVKEFILVTDPLNNPKIAKKLTEAQQYAVLDYYVEQGFEWEVTMPATTSAVSTLDGNPRALSITAYGSTGATREYTFNANFSWEWFGDGSGYTNVSSNSNGYSNALLGKYVRGSRIHGKTTVNDSYFTAYETGQFALEFGGAFRTVTAKVKIRGNEEGKHNILEKRAPL